MKIRFDGRVVVITGAAGALGTAYALAFAERGARLVVNDLGSDKDGTGISGAAAERLAERVRGSGGEALATMDDVGTRDGAARLIARTIESYGRIDVLVNNAGIMRDRAFKKMDMDDFDEVVRVNLAGCAYVSRSALPHMIEQQFGRILMVTSAAGLYGVFGAANYVAAKMGVARPAYRGHPSQHPCQRGGAGGCQSIARRVRVGPCRSRSAEPRVRRAAGALSVQRRRATLRPDIRGRWWLLLEGRRGRGIRLACRPW